MNKGSAVIFAANEVGIINSITTARTLGYTVIHLIVLSRSEAMSEVARRSVSRESLKRPLYMDRSIKLGQGTVDLDVPTFVFEALF